jgi:hypothetical protein
MGSRAKPDAVPVLVRFVIGAFVGAGVFAAVFLWSHAQREPPLPDAVQRIGVVAADTIEPAGGDLARWWGEVDEDTRATVVKLAMTDERRAALLLRYAATKDRTDVPFAGVEPFVAELEGYEPAAGPEGDVSANAANAFGVLPYLAYVTMYWVNSGPYPEHADRIASVALHAATDRETTLQSYAAALLLAIDQDGLLPDAARTELNGLLENETVAFDAPRHLATTRAHAQGVATRPTP